MHHSAKILCAAMSSLWLAACSTVIEGTSQEIAVSSLPTGANCIVQRAGSMIVPISITPFAIEVDKTKDDIRIDCSKEGYAPANGTLTSDIAAATFGNAIAGGLVGWGVDSMDGADNKYSSSVTIPLTPLPVNQTTASAVRACNAADFAVQNVALNQGVQYRATCR